MDGTNQTRESNEAIAKKAISNAGLTIYVIVKNFESYVDISANPAISFIKDVHIA